MCTPELTHILCFRLLDGESLRSICTDDAMPARSTVLYWLAGAWPEGDPRREFLGQYARAREAQAELYADDIIDIADADDGARPRPSSMPTTSSTSPMPTTRTRS